MSRSTTSNDELRYFAIAKPNSGSDAVFGKGWETNQTESEVQAWITANPDRRIHDIQPYDTPGGSIRYAFTWIGNVGDGATDSWVLHGPATLDEIEQTKDDNDARIVDIEPESDGRWSAILVPIDPGISWWWFTNVEPATAADTAAKFGGRIVDAELYSTNSGDRLAILVMRNCTDLALNANRVLRNGFDIPTDSGIAPQTTGRLELGVDQRKLEHSNLQVR